MIIAYSDRYLKQSILLVEGVGYRMQGMRRAEVTPGLAVLTAPGPCSVEVQHVQGFEISVAVLD